MSTEKIKVTEENWEQFEAAVRAKLAQPFSIEVNKEQAVWAFLGDIGFEFDGPQGIRVLQDCLAPMILKKVPDARFDVNCYENGFRVSSAELWTKACIEARLKWVGHTPHSFGNVPVIQLP